MMGVEKQGDLLRDSILEIRWLLQHYFYRRLPLYQTNTASLDPDNIPEKKPLMAVKD
jgi:hypothetical protein